MEKYSNKIQKKVKRNLLLPSDFLKKWISTRDDGKQCFRYIDFSSDSLVEVEVENDPLINVLFSWDDSFDIDRINKQYNQISKIAKAIFERRVDKKDKEIKLTGKELLFIKYFYFLVSLLNGDYKYHYASYEKTFRVFDSINQEAPIEVRKSILSIISYALFEMYDYIFTPRVFESLYEYVENSEINFINQEYHRQIFVPINSFKDFNYKFLDVYFHNIVNNTFIKIYKVSPLDRTSFILTNKTIASFIDQKTKINVLSTFVVDPRFAIGLVNLGPGRGEYRPLFKYLISDDKLDTDSMPSCVKPEITVEENGIYLSEEQKFLFKPFELTDKQVKLINDCLRYRDLKADFDQFAKN
ncbi:hypothetical protein SGLAD_v1c05160 [Spiroplasma gladiatoris]|uniref:DUF4238 domain-containing protein n=1 Tax=Spiroplasma gladiatoris TaxID=2143 RepID=A0A4P7AH20_9MOLU|nr:hypothetical protein [Spiroplasma gladiatoris]QBQ07715.1 hypothetical protein SGLAD_v1c05160 [Spiroplasma gladiatoris]